MAEMCLARREVEPLSLEDRQIWLGILSSYFPSLFQGGRQYEIPFRLTHKIFNILWRFAERSGWVEGFLQSFWLDVISRPFMEDITLEYKEARNDLWQELFDIVMAETSRGRRGCF